MEFISAASLTALLQIIMIDLVLAGDNAIVIGLAAAGLPKEQRSKAIMLGILAATVLRITFAAGTQYLLEIVGLLLAGGLLLLWVCWKMWEELRTTQHDYDAADAALHDEPEQGVTPGARKKPSGARSPRSWSPTSRCRSTTCSPWPAPPASTSGC